MNNKYSPFTFNVSSVKASRNSVVKVFDISVELDIEIYFLSILKMRLTCFICVLYAYFLFLHIVQHRQFLSVNKLRIFKFIALCFLQKHFYILFRVAPRILRFARVPCNKVVYSKERK